MKTNTFSNIFLVVFNILISTSTPHYTNLIMSKTKNLKNQDSDSPGDNYIEVKYDDKPNESQNGNNRDYKEVNEYNSFNGYLLESKSKSYNLQLVKTANPNNPGNKSQVTAFLLEFFLPIGIGHYYCRRWLHGALKTGYLLLVIGIDFLLKYKIYAVTTFKVRQNVNYVVYTLYLLFIIFQLVDVVMFGLNKYKDGYGSELIPMETK